MGEKLKSWTEKIKKIKSEKIVAIFIFICILTFVFYDVFFTDCLSLLVQGSLCPLNWSRVVLIILFIILSAIFFLNDVKDTSKCLKKYKVKDFSIYLWEIIISFLLMAVSLYLALVSENGTINVNKGPFRVFYEFHGVYNAISFFSLILLLILVYKSGFANWIKNISQTVSNNFIRKTATENEFFIVVIIILGLCPIILTFLLNDLFEKTFHGSFLGVSYTLIGVFVGSLIYFKLKDKTITLQEYMNTSIKILESSKENDVVFIIAPTLFLGHEYNIGLYKRYTDTIFEKIEMNVTLHIANLLIPKEKLKAISVEDLNNFVDYIKLGKKTHDELSDEEKVNCDNAPDFLDKKEIISKDDNENDKGLFDFHWVYFKFNDNKEKNKEKIAIHYKKLILFYQKILNLEKSKKLILKGLNWNYYDKPQMNELNTSEDKQGTNQIENSFKSNFFAVANTSQGLYYFGQYKIYSDKDHEFHGTFFENKYIKGEIYKLLGEFIEKAYPVK